MSNIEDVRNLLFSAVSCGDLEQVEELVNQYGLSYSPDLYKGYVLLLNATLFGYKKIVKLLLEKGANVCSQFSRVDTPLHFAAWFGDLELVQWLIDYEAPVNAKDRQWETPLHVACQKGHEDVVEFLLDRGSDPNTVRELPAIEKQKFVHLKFNQVVFAAACQNGHKEFRELLNHGAQINTSDNDNPLPLLSGNDCRDALKKLTYRKSEDEGNVTPLHLAAEMGRSKIVELLLSKGAYVNAQTSKDSTPLLLAAARGHTDVAKMLLEHGACANTNDESSTSPLHLAVLKGYTKMVKSLLDWGAVIDDGNPNFSLLHSAVERGLKGIVSLFLNSGCDVSAKDQFGNALISYSLKDNRKGKHAKTIQLLLDHGADLKDAPGLLHIAILQQNIDVCQTLIKNGMGVNALCNNNIIILLPSDVKRAHQIASVYEYVKAQYLDHYGTISSNILLPAADEDLTPLQLACHLGYKTIADLLLSNGANIEARQLNGLTPLHIAAWGGRADIVEMLLQFNADIDVRGASNETALHYAVLGNQDKIISLLLENGCDVNIESVDSETAFELAVLKSRSIMLQLPQNDLVIQILAPSDSSHNRSHQLIIKVFEDHLVKLKVAGIYVLEKLTQLVNFDHDLVHFQQKCEEELRKMKCETLINNCTLGGIFMRLSNPQHMRNASWRDIQAFENRYPIYENLLLSWFKKSRKRLKLLDSGKEWLRILMKTSNTLNLKPLPIPAWPELEEIVSYLSNAELLSLICCGENLKKQLCQ